MEPVYDAIVIGGGPAGSTVATCLAKARRRVLVLERERFPRFHVGESLLPYSLPIFERLGVAEKIRKAGFQEKYGAFFWNDMTGEGTRPVVFSDAFNDRHPMAYQVKRADFDDLLLKHAAECGAEVRQETAVQDALFEGSRAVGVRAVSKDDRVEEIRARAVVDASGQGAFLSKKLGTRRFDSRLKRAALFAHYERIRWPEGHRPGDILLPIDAGVWYWIIPFSDGSSSVGAVFEPSIARESGAPGLEERFEFLLARSPRMPELLAGSRRISKVFAISDYSATSGKMAGDGYVLVGDAATFLDPVFSTGVFLALATGERAARAVDRALAKHGRLDAKDLVHYEREAAKLFARFRRFVYNFYDPVFFEAFCTPDPPEPMRKAVTTVLAGGVESPPLALKIWTQLMLWAVGFDRLRRRIGLGPKPNTLGDERSAA
ncbi:MAG TPA: NAD(P)/FAD-dependent oxidoreductase [Thermoanaerobaculia bacterium]|nr:NAD(P)/FAD-dependent oxidoreductase [Thermoanaerobaculia bacterium]